MDIASHYVPRPSGCNGCTVVLPPIDAMRLAARERLATCLRSPNTDSLGEAWEIYERTVIRAHSAYHALDAMHAAVHTSLARVGAIGNAWIGRLLDDLDNSLTLALTELCKREDDICAMASPVRKNSHEFARAVEAVTVSMTRVLHELRLKSIEYVKPLATDDHADPVTGAWRGENGLKKAAMYDSHFVGEVPANTKAALLATTGCTADGASLQLGWDYINRTPLGMRLGMAVRYAGVDGNVCAMALIEQLLMPPSESLIDASLHGRLLRMLYAKPNAAVTVNNRVPLLAIMYAVRARRDLSEADISEAIESVSPTALRRAMCARLAKFENGWLATNDERRDFAVPHINAFLGMAAVFFMMARKLTTEQMTAHQPAGMTELQRSLHQVMSCLVALKEDSQKSQVAARMLWWLRYAKRGDADENEFWRWTVRADLMLADLEAFTVSSPWVGSPTWLFAPENVSTKTPQ